MREKKKLEVCLLLQNNKFRIKEYLKIPICGELRMGYMREVMDGKLS